MVMLEASYTAFFDELEKIAVSPTWVRNTTATAAKRIASSGQAGADRVQKFVVNNIKKRNTLQAAQKKPFAGRAAWKRNEAVEEGTIAGHYSKKPNPWHFDDNTAQHELKPGTR
jgi:hypothetical protein